MKNLNTLLVACGMTMAFCVAGGTANADPLSLTLLAPFQSTGEPNVLAFDATVTNTTGQTVYLNGDSPTIESPLTVDDSSYINGFPLSLAGGASYTGELFLVDVPLGTPLGLYEGVFEITGGADDSASDVVGTANFDVNVTPEPSSLLLLGTGLVCGMAGFGGSWRRCWIP